MKVYLAARWERAEEMCQYAQELQGIGIIVISTWMYNHGAEWSIGAEDVSTVYGMLEATRDIDQIGLADIVVSFTEDPTTAWVRGGRHWESGYAYASGIDQLIVGPREVVFHCMPDYDQVDTWEQAKQCLAWYKEGLEP